MAERDDATNGVEPDQSSFPGGISRGEMASSNFTIVSNLVMRDPNLSCAAKGLFGNLASHRADFAITEGFLASQCADGVKAIRRTLQELRAAGYLYRGERLRHPQGTRNAAGKDISGSLGSYKWYVTDKPDEVAEFLKRYREERPDGDPHFAGQDRVPKRPSVVTSDDTDAEPVDNSTDGSSLAAETADSDDQGKDPKTAGHYCRPKPPGGTGTALEDDREKTIGEKNNSPSPWHGESPHAGEAEQGQGETPPGNTNDEDGDRSRVARFLGNVIGAIPAEQAATVTTSEKHQLVDLVLDAEKHGVEHGSISGELANVRGTRQVGQAWIAKVRSLIDGTTQKRTGGMPPRCGQCEARYDSDPVSARVAQRDGRDVWCPRCHPKGTPEPTQLHADTDSARLDSSQTA